jgi:LCP family protein required for cell wall assembly
MKVFISSKGDSIFLATFTAIGILVTIILTVLSTGYHISIEHGGKPLFRNGLIFGAIPKEKEAADILGRDYLSVLIIGSDAHLEYDPGRSDTIMWALIDLRGKKVDILSIPRDTLVRIPSSKGGYFDKIAHAYSHGGSKLVRQAVEKFLGIKIDQVVRVDYNGFIKIIDNIGGVTVDVEKQMDYDDRAGDLHIHLKKGRQLLNGEKALEYVRYRHDALGDLARIQRQQKLIAAIKDKGLRIGQIRKIDDIARIIADNVYLTSGDEDGKPLSAQEILTLMIFFLKLDDGSIRYHSVPVGAEVMYNKLSSIVPDYKGLNELMLNIVHGNAPTSANGDGQDAEAGASKPEDGKIM